MSAKIYLLQDDGTLQSLTEKPYANEGLLQELLVNYPDLLAGDQIDETSPRRWLLVSREFGVPLEKDGGDQMSIDHLFLDQDAVPTLVEVKRSSDTRIRREVVGQMLDYASHAVAYWSAETIRARFESRCEVEQKDPIQVTAQFIETEDDADVEAFWGQVKTNLQAGRIRLIFVADEIPAELRRVVEFLNRFMDPVQVLAVEVPQYVGQGLSTLVPRLIGQTTETQKKSTGGSAQKKQWDEQTFFQALEERKGTVQANIARKILNWAQNKATRIYWGRGSRSGAFVPILNHKDRDHQLFVVWTYGTIEIYFYWYQYKEPFDSEEKRRELLNRLNAIEGVSLPEDVITKRPGIPLTVVLNEKELSEFIAAFEWMIDEIKAS